MAHLAFVAQLEFVTQCSIKSTVFMLTQSSITSLSVSIARYTLFIVIRKQRVVIPKQRQNHFFTKKFEFRETAKTGLHTIHHRSQFSRTCVETENTTKKVL